MSLRTTTPFYRPIGIAALTSIMVGASPNAVAQSDDLFNLSLEELGKVRVISLATGTERPLDQAAAVATIITEKDIDAMGATDIDQVLETVPGLHVGRSDQGFAPKYNIRGITSTFNAQTLMLVNGIPVTDLVFGNRGNAWGGMPLKAIKRIEVIRGPGSAMHGADAFSGVINIVTKNRKDINGTSGGVRAGSFDTQAAWIQHGENYKGYDVAVSLEYETTEGHDTIVEADVLGRSGPMNVTVDSIDARVEISKDNSLFRLGYQDRSNLGPGIGVLPILDSEGRFGSQRLNADYTHFWNDIADDLNVEGRLSYFRNTQEVEDNIVLAPPGAFPGFPDGFIGNPGFKEQYIRADSSVIYTGIDNHTVRIGAGYFWGDVYETSETKNFNPDNSPRVDGLEDVSDTDEVFLPETDRESRHFFVQDEWKMAKNWHLTTGVRYDHFSDFGDTTNPRLALVWTTTDTITTKFLYGKAFRAPSINELFATSNPVVQGDPGLDPDTIDTYEVAFAHQASSKLHYSVNVFYYEIDGLITLVPVTASVSQWTNSSDRTGYGAEFELSYAFDRQLKALFNLAYQNSEEDDTGEDVGDAPERQAYARLEWRPSDRWLISSQVNWVGEQKRIPTDTTRTESVPHYTVVDLLVKQNDVVKDLDIALSFKNLFDRKYREPSGVSPLPFGGPAADFSMAGREIFVEASYRF